MKKTAQDVWDAMRPTEREQLLRGDTDIRETIDILEDIVGDGSAPASTHIPQPAHAAPSQKDWDSLPERERERLLSDL